MLVLYDGSQRYPWGIAIGFGKLSLLNLELDLHSNNTKFVFKVISNKLFEQTAFISFLGENEASRNTHCNL
jgi:hypothetical protein